MFLDASLVLAACLLIPKVVFLFSPVFIMDIGTLAPVQGELSVKENIPHYEQAYSCLSSHLDQATGV
jgi:hypothetical protein